MKSKIPTISICLILLFISFSGCFEDTSEKNQKTVYVDNDGIADYIKIQDAIDNVTEGYTIIVRNGTYSEQLILDKSINLISEYDNKAIITRKTVINPSSDSIIIVNADKCTIKGFNITCNIFNSDFKCYNIGINITSSDNKILNNIILSSDKGIYIGSKSKNNKISLNTVSNANYGMEIDQSDNNNIFENKIYFCKENGIYLYGAKNNVISGNNISNNNYGIWAKGSEKNNIFENSIKKNEHGILFCCLAKNNVVYKNIFMQNLNWSARDDVNNQWDDDYIGNYWDDYTDKYPDAVIINGIWNIPYNITGITEGNIDRFPLVKPVDI